MQRGFRHGQLMRDVLILMHKNIYTHTQCWRKILNITLYSTIPWAAASSCLQFKSRPGMQLLGCKFTQHYLSVRLIQDADLLQMAQQSWLTHTALTLHCCCAHTQRSAPTTHPAPLSSAVSIPQRRNQHLPWDYNIHIVKKYSLQIRIISLFAVFSAVLIWL